MTPRLGFSDHQYSNGVRRYCVLAVCLLSQIGWTASYKQGDAVILYVNKVGPYHNPQETYHYYTLPVCRPDQVSHRTSIRQLIQLGAL